MIRLFVYIEERVLAIADRYSSRLGAFLRQHSRLIKYVCAGGTAAVTDLGLLFIFTDLFGFHYLISATIAFIVAFWVSFFLQKFWTFGDETRDRMHAQLLVYFLIALANVAMNTLLMYFFVDVVGIWYLLAQVIVGALIACYSFLVYRRFVFTSTH